MRTGPFFLALLLCALPGEAQGNFLGRVVGVSDGDTVTVLDEARVSHKIRILGIDAPEKNQPYGKVSKQVFSDLLMGRQVEVRGKKRDRYGRELAKVMVDGRDAGLEQVKAGMAWWYRHYSGDQPSEDRGRYEAAERAAQTGRRGLWIDPDPQPPWEFRRAKRSKNPSFAFSW